MMSNQRGSSQLDAEWRLMVAPLIREANKFRS